MLVAAVALIFASVLFWFGLVRSHWVAPGAFFAASGPVVAIFSSEHDAAQIGIHLLTTLLLFYTAFAGGRLVADRAIGSR